MKITPTQQLHNRFSEKISAGILKSVIEEQLKVFLIENKNIIDSVFKNSDDENELFYYIVLKKDNNANRIKIFKFLDSQDDFEFSIKASIHFQFVPLTLKKHIELEAKPFLTF